MSLLDELVKIEESADKVLDKTLSSAWWSALLAAGIAVILFVLYRML